MTTKKCSICQEEKDISFFYWMNNRNKGPYSICKSCCHKRYEDHKNDPSYEKYKETRSVQQKLRRKEMKEKINRIKLEKSCLICGSNSFASSLLFHHINSNEKEDSIAELKQHATLDNFETIIKEMDKCVVLCFNCHIALHRGLIQLP